MALDDSIRQEVASYATMSVASLLMLEQQKLGLVCDALRLLILAGDSGMLDQWLQARNAAQSALTLYAPRETMQGSPE